MKKAMLMALAVLASASSLSAADKDQDKDRDKAVAEAPPKEKPICRTERVTGSRIATKRICMTKEQWDNMADQTRKNLDDFSRNSGNATNAKSPIGP